MKYNIAICDDSETDRKYISDLVNNWAEIKEFRIHISKFSSAENFMFHYQEKKDYDILLLDIEMGAMDGVSMAKKLRQTNDSIQIVFITGYSDYICEGYEVEALHYLMKPVKEDKLYSILDRAIEKVAKNDKVLIFETSGEMIRIPIYQIRYAEVSGNYVTVHAVSDSTIKMTLSELEKELDERFFRVSRSEIVNLNCISRVTKKDIVLNDGAKIILPRGAYDKVNRAIIDMK